MTKLSPTQIPLNLLGMLPNKKLGNVIMSVPSKEKGLAELADSFG